MEIGEGVFSDKENSGEIEEVEGEVERPAKRVKVGSVSPVKGATTTSAGGFGGAKKGAIMPEKKRSTLGVKPKGTKSLPPVSAKKTTTTATNGGMKKAGATTGGGGGGGPTTISQARLNALSQPKRR